MHRKKHTRYIFAPLIKNVDFEQKREKARTRDMKIPEVKKRRAEMLARPRIARRVEWCAWSAFLMAGTP